MKRHLPNSQLLFTVGMTGMGVFAWWVNSTRARSSTGELALDLRVALLRQAAGEFAALVTHTRGMVMVLSDIMHAGLFVVDSTDPNFSPLVIAGALWPMFHQSPLLLALGYQGAVGQTLVTLSRLQLGLPVPILLTQNGSSTFYMQALDAALGIPLGEPVLAPIPPTNLHGDRKFQQVARRPVRGELHYSLEELSMGGPLLSISIPVFTPGGEFSAVMGTGVQLTLVSTFLSTLPLRGGGMFVMMGSGQMLASSHNETLVRNRRPVFVFDANDVSIRDAGQAILDQLVNDRARCLSHLDTTGCAGADTWLVSTEVVAGNRTGSPQPAPNFIAWAQAKPGPIHGVYTLGEGGSTYISMMLLEIDHGFSVVAVLLIPRDNIMGEINEASKKTLLAIMLVALATAAIGSVVSLTLTLKIKEEVELGRRLEVANLQLHELKHRAEVSNETKSAFLANISHEIRTPMTSILGCVDLLLMDPLLGSARGSVEIIKRASTMLLNILNSLLDLAKIDSGRMELEEDSVDLWGMLTSLVDMYSVNVGKRQIDVILDLADNVPHVVRGDVTRIQQILNNLCSNALKFTCAGHVAVRARVLEADSVADRETWAQIKSLRRRQEGGSLRGNNFFGSNTRARRAASSDAQSRNNCGAGAIAITVHPPDAGPPLLPTPAPSPRKPARQGRREGAREGGLRTHSCTPWKYTCVGLGARAGESLRQLWSVPRRKSKAGDAEVSADDDKDLTPLSSPSHLWLEFEVDDSGVGIPRNKWEAVFDDFNQADTSTTRVYGGTGLGLSIVRRLVRLMKGDIIVAPKDSPGTLFRFWINLRRCDCRLHNLPIPETTPSTPRESFCQGRRPSFGGSMGTAFRLLSTMSTAADRALPSSAADRDFLQHIEEVRNRSRRNSNSSRRNSNSSRPNSNSCRNSISLHLDPSCAGFVTKSRFCGMAGCAAPECNARPMPRCQLSRPVLLCMRPGMARDVTASWVARMGAPVLPADTLESLLKLAPTLCGAPRAGQGVLDGPRRREGSGACGAYDGHTTSRHNGQTSTADEGAPVQQGSGCHCALGDSPTHKEERNGSLVGRSTEADRSNHPLLQEDSASDVILTREKAQGATSTLQGDSSLLPTVSCPIHGDSAAWPADFESIASSSRHTGSSGFIVVIDEAVLMRAAATMPSAEALVSSVSLGLVAVAQPLQPEGACEDGRETRGCRFTRVANAQVDGYTDVAVLPTSSMAHPSDLEASSSRGAGTSHPSCPAMPGSGDEDNSGIRAFAGSPQDASTPRPLLSLPLLSHPATVEVAPAADAANASSMPAAEGLLPCRNASATSCSAGDAPSHVRLSLSRKPAAAPHELALAVSHSLAGSPLATPSWVPRRRFGPRGFAEDDLFGTFPAETPTGGTPTSRGGTTRSGRAGTAKVESRLGTHHLRSRRSSGNTDYVPVWSPLDDIKDRMDSAGVSLVLLASCNGARSDGCDAPFDDLALHSAARRVGALVYMPLHRLRLHEALQEVEAEILLPHDQAPQGGQVSTPSQAAHAPVMEEPEGDRYGHTLIQGDQLQHDQTKSMIARVEPRPTARLPAEELPATAPLASASSSAPGLEEVAVIADSQLVAAAKAHQHSNGETAGAGAETAPAQASTVVALASPSSEACANKEKKKDQEDSKEDKPLVLLVEDTEINQRIFKKMLKSMGVDVDVASDGAEAVEAWKKKSYDLVLMDCHLPVLDGYEATMAIRSLEAQSSTSQPTPIVALTADAMVSNRRRCEEAGMTSFLTKPISQFNLQRGVMAWSLRKPKKLHGAAT
eukprot:jgi/Mesvir1/28813/Mv12897-RA.1